MIPLGMFIIALFIYGFIFLDISIMKEKAEGKNYKFSSTTRNIYLSISMLLYATSYFLGSFLNEVQKITGNIEFTSSYSKQEQADYLNQLLKYKIGFWCTLLIAIFFAFIVFYKLDDEIKERGIKSDSMYLSDEEAEAKYLSSANYLSAEEKPIKCPSCGSTQFTANKKGVSVGKALLGYTIMGPIGLMAGDIGKDKMEITCLKCGRQWTVRKS